MNQKIYNLMIAAALGLSACTAEVSITPPSIASDDETAEPVEKISIVNPEQIETESFIAGTDPIGSQNENDAILPAGSYPIADTNQENCYGEDQGISCPARGTSFSGQDAQYEGNPPEYIDNGDGTITDAVTGLMWAQSPDLNGDGSIDASDKLTYVQALTGAGDYSLAGYDDWRLPTIKELYSLIDFSGIDPSGWTGTDASGLTPFIDESFTFGYGDTEAGERIIDAQFASSTKYVSTTMGGNKTMFGVNFADGRIKGYPASSTGSGPGGKLYYVLYVRGNPEYGINNYLDNQNGTIADLAAGLTWMQSDSGEALNWEDALAYCEDLDYAGRNDWRLPDAKELQSIVDYSRSPDTTNSAAIDPLFTVTEITNEAGQLDYPAYWSSTTHVNMRGGGNAAYILFGRGLGYMNGQWMDVHGAGAQRSDPKNGDPGDYPTDHGPQGDAVRVYNFARCVSGGVEAVPGSAYDGEAVAGVKAAPAVEGDPPAGGLPGGSPPPEAINACSESMAGEVCQFNAPQGVISGTCMQMSAQLVCVPEVGPPQGGQP